MRDIAVKQLGVDHAFNLVTVHLAPEQIVVAIDLAFDDGLSPNDIEQTVSTLERSMKEAHQSVVAVFVEKAAGQRTA